MIERLYGKNLSWAYLTHPVIPYRITCVVHFSGGVCSWAAAKRAVEQYGRDGMVLLFADTLIEDPTLYTFLYDAADNLGVPLVHIADGRTPFEVFREVRFLGNSRVDPCSKHLKRDLLARWCEENAEPDAVHVFGMDWNEPHRLKRLRERFSPDHPERVQAPMVDKPWMHKDEMIRWCESEGLRPSELYKEGFPHANCGGGCIKAGIAHFRHLLKVRPETFRRWENEEQSLRHLLGDVSILKDRRNGETTTLTLQEVRRQSNKQLSFDDAMDWGGCGCAVD